MKDEAGWLHYLRLCLNIIIPAAGWLFLCVAGPKLLRFFMPFVIGWGIAALANPLVRFLERKVRLVRRHSSFVIVVAALASVIGLIYLALSRSFFFLRGFVKELPALYASIEEDVSRSLERIDHLFQFLPDSIGQSWESVGDSLGTLIGAFAEKLASPTVEAAGSVARGLPAMLVYFVVTVLSAYFFIVDRDRIVSAIKGRLPESAERYCHYLKRDVFHLIGGYFKAQFKIMGVVWLILTAGFLLLGVSYGPLWAILIAALDFLPVFGTGTALIPWGVLKLLGGEYYLAAGLFGLYVLTQFIRQLVQPKLVGDSMGMPPLLTLFFLYLGFKISGIAGMILAVPMGMFFVNLYEYGAFKGLTESLGELAEDINAFRKKKNHKSASGEPEREDRE